MRGREEAVVTCKDMEMSGGQVCVQREMGRKEIRTANEKMKVSHDGITAEMLKCGGEAVVV